MATMSRVTSRQSAPRGDPRGIPKRVLRKQKLIRGCLEGFGAIGIQIVKVGQIHQVCIFCIAKTKYGLFMEHSRLFNLPDLKGIQYIFLYDLNFLKKILFLFRRN